MSEPRQKIRGRRLTVLVGLALGLLILCIIALSNGEIAVSPAQAIGITFNEIGVDLGIEYESRQQTIVRVIRLPRIIMGVLIGASLASSSALIQGLFRNPLADPGLIGISSGGAFATVLMIAMSSALFTSEAEQIRFFSVPIAAAIGTGLTTLLMYRLATFGGRTSVPTMLLIGIAFNALANAGVGMIVASVNSDDLRNIEFWSLGSMARANWEAVGTVLPFVLLSILPAPLLARPLNALLLGDNEADHLGINVERIKVYVVVLASLGIGAGVGFVGIISFVGLAAPHALRLLIGADHRYILPGSALMGALMVIGADLVARLVVAPIELPLGVITALLGAPFFLALLLQDRRQGAQL